MTGLKANVSTMLWGTVEPQEKHRRPYMKSLNTERIPNPITFYIEQKEVISPLFQVLFQGAHMTWLKQGTSALFLIGTFLQFWLACLQSQYLCRLMLGLR